MREVGIAVQFACRGWWLTFLLSLSRSLTIFVILVLVFCTAPGALLTKGRVRIRLLHNPIPKVSYVPDNHIRCGNSMQPQREVALRITA